MSKTYFYKGVRVNAFGIPVSKEKVKHKESEPKRIYNTSFDSPFKHNAPRNLIVMYDIPHTMKKERDWFRRQLVNFGYIMIQRSVWVGPSPLPKEFIDYIKAIGLHDHLKTFKLAKAYTGKDGLFK